MATFTIPAALRSTTAMLVAPVGGVVIPANAKTATVTLLMPVDAERALSSQHIDFGVELLISPSTTWKPYLLAGWNGGTGVIGKFSTVVNTPPSATLGGDFFAGYAGQLARLRATLTVPMTLGARIDVT
jgi:hypothetical protein